MYFITEPLGAIVLAATLLVALVTIDRKVAK